MIPGAGESLSGADNAWWRMGDRTNLMEITGVLVFDDRVTYPDLVETFEERLVAFRRFRQRVVGRDFGRRPRWAEDEEFDIESHVHHVALPEPQDIETFQSFVGDVMSQPIDKTKPLWQAHLVEGVGDGNALVIRIHHSVADGFALLYVLLGLADDPGSIELPIGTMPTPPKREVDGGNDAGERSDNDSTGSEGTEESERSGGGGSDEGDDGRSLAEVIQRTVNMTKPIYRVLTMDEEPKTSLVGDLGVQKRVSWTDPVPVEDVKAAGRPYDATINDVLLAATAGALGRHLQAHGESIEDLTLRATVPVNLKPLDQRSESLGNYFGLGFLELPVWQADVERRLELIQANTGELKQGTEAYLLYRLLQVFGRGPPTLQDLALRVFRDKATAVVTNVPGPTDAFELCGEEVSDLVFWVPQSNGIGLGISILSYDGDVRVGVAADKGLLPEPDELAGAFEAELQAITDEGEGGHPDAG